MRRLPRDVEIWSGDLGGVSHKDRSNRSRYLLLNVLSTYLEVSPFDVLLAQTDAGKPYVPDSILRFSVSHTGDLWLCAVTTGRAVGIDAELESDLDDLRLLRYVCSRREWESIQSAAASEQAPTFLRIWTRKEALLKAIGTGVMVKPLDSIDALDALTFVDAFPYRICDVAMEGVHCAIACSGSEPVTIRSVVEVESPTMV